MRHTTCCMIVGAVVLLAAGPAMTASARDDRRPVQSTQQTSAQPRPQSATTPKPRPAPPAPARPPTQTSVSQEAAQAALLQQQTEAWAQEADLLTFYNGIEKFSIDMLRRLAGGSPNVAFSPLTTWLLLALMSEGATGTTQQELRTTLALPQEAATLHRGFGQIRGDIQRSSQGGNSTLEMGSAVFTSPYQPLKPEFERIAESYYNTTLEHVNFHDETAAAATINAWVSALTRGHIPTIVNPDELKNAEVVLTSALYFRGAWRDAFNESQTRTEPFVDDEGRKVADVDMMYQAGAFRMSYIDTLGALALELPYASERNSMLLLLPRRGSTLPELLDKIGNSSLPFVATVMNKLREDAALEEDDEIHVYLPRFTLDSQLSLNTLLKKMGIRALFQQGRNELSGLSTLNLYVSALVHKAAVSVTEQGTVAAAASAAVLHNYSLPSTFKANRPFLFMIVQKATNTILFAGKVGNPNPNATHEVRST